MHDASSIEAFGITCYFYEYAIFNRNIARYAILYKLQICYFLSAILQDSMKESFENYNFSKI